MKSAATYLFTSARLGFRTWLESDIALMSAVNADPAVMQYFPSIQTTAQTTDFINRMNTQFDEKGFCYFAVETLADGNFIGFTGLSEQTWEAPFTPCIDIGWRLRTTAWYKGYATEAAKRCLAYGFNNARLNIIYGMAPLINKRSERVMQKAGMHKAGHFIHPKLAGSPELETCVLYKITRDASQYAQAHINPC